MMQADLEHDQAALAKEVRYLRDRLDIQDCIHRYCRGLDRLDRELALSAYHPDAIDDRGPHVGSPAEFYDWVTLELRKMKGTAHSISNITCEIDGDVAHTESYITFHVWWDDGRPVTFGQARYLDRFERRNGRWAIAHREALIDYRGEIQLGEQRGTELSGIRSKEDRSYLRPLGLDEDGRRRLAEKRRA